MHPDYSRAERRVDAIIHACGMLLTAGAVLLLLWRVAPAADLRRLAAALAYCAGLLATIGCSAAYHLMPRPDWREFVRRCDRTAIYLMIAGTYTPVALVGLAGRAGVGLLAAVWLVALTGSALVWLRPRRYERASIVLYLALGWIGLPALGRLVATLPAQPLALLGAGAALYCIGVGFLVWERLPGHNAVWHGFVLAAAACHYVAILLILTG